MEVNSQVWKSLEEEAIVLVKKLSTYVVMIFSKSA